MPPRRPPAKATWDSLLHSLRLTGALYCRATLKGSWNVVVPDFEGVLMFGILTEGAAWLEHGKQRRALGPGSLWLFPRGGRHRLFSDAKAPAVALEKLPVQPMSEHYEVLDYGARGAATKITYGVVRFDEAIALRLLGALPDCVCIDTKRVGTRRWLAQTVELITEEAAHVELGGDTVLTRLADVIVIQAIRSWLADAASSDRGWLAAVRDERIGRAIAELHRAPGKDWTLQGLARVAGISRSVFALRFNELVGEPAMTYVTWFRMQTACARLRDTDEPLARLAESLGYRSEAAFGRTFKRTIGSSPARYRKSSRALVRSAEAARRG